MIQLAPSILSCDPSQFRPSVAEMMEAGVDWIHFDVMDGQFVPPITFGADLVKSLRSLGKTPFEAHLMTLTPDAHFDAFVKAGCRRIIFHAEATHHAHRLVQTLHDMGVEAGVAINPGTPEDVILPVIGDIDLALVMTVNPGWGGQQFIASTLKKIEALKRARPDLDIEVDGGIDPTTILGAMGAGANVFVTGSFLMRSSSIAKGVQELRAACA
ncbi:MAG TPA: ribulose-phosphate 3-epimerase [Fimbriimonadaceae bacterium]|nr:ribulose-phosphate 3-epimerase [Fimbriimonadaceae bacterium]